MKRLPITFYHTWLPLSPEERYRDMCEFAAGGGNIAVNVFLLQMLDANYRLIDELRVFRLFGSFIVRLKDFFQDAIDMKLINAISQSAAGHNNTNTIVTHNKISFNLMFCLMR